jgi:hypothetical protein
MVRYTWSEEVQGVNYSESCTNRKIMVEDTKTPEELYDRIQTELWFVMRKLLEFDIFKSLPSTDISELSSQLTTRWYRATGKISKVESKDDYKLRNNANSPDEADAVSLMAHAARHASQVIFGMTAENVSADGFDDDSPTENYHVCVTNRFEELPDDP